MPIAITLPAIKSRPRRPNELLTTIRSTLKLKPSMANNALPASGTRIAAGFYWSSRFFGTPAFRVVTAFTAPEILIRLYLTRKGRSHD